MCLDVFNCQPDERAMAALRIHLNDIPMEGMNFECHVPSAALEGSLKEEIVGEGFEWKGFVTRISDGAYVEGTLSYVVRRECVRCLQGFLQPVCLSCTAVFQSDGRAKRAAADSSSERSETGLGSLGEEPYPCIGDQIDLTVPLREQVILEVPIQSLCQPQCRGLCLRCGANLNDRDCGCTPEEEWSTPFSVLDRYVNSSNRD